MTAMHGLDVPDEQGRQRAGVKAEVDQALTFALSRPQMGVEVM